VGNFIILVQLVKELAFSLVMNKIVDIMPT